MGLSEVCFEFEPCLVGLDFSIPLVNRGFETPSLVYNDISLGDGLFVR